jgi:putative solute:sodium symporter small subunit
MSEQSSDLHSRRYWKKSIVLVLALLVIWFLVSLGAGILFRDWLDETFPKIGNAPLGFWMAQQGAIVCFIIILLIYRFMMNKLEGEEGFTSKK